MPPTTPKPVSTLYASESWTGDRRDRWLPPVVAILLFLLAAGSLLFWLPLSGPDGSGQARSNGDGGSGISQQAGTLGAASGKASSGLQDNPDTLASSVPDDQDYSVQQGQTPQAPTPPASSNDAPRSAASSATSPELGFSSDLTAIRPEPQQPAQRPTQVASPPAGPPGDASTRGGGQDGLPSFFDQVGHGSHFTFIIDKSGSMAGEAFEDARFELIRTLRSLRPHETFYVIFYDTEAEPMPAPGPVPATQVNIERYVRWIRDVSTGGGTDPTEALTLALTRLRPDTIWLLSDGSFNVAVTETITRLNAQRRVHINTLAFRNRDGETILKIIADENQGDYRFVGP